MSPAPTQTIISLAVATYYGAVDQFSSIERLTHSLKNPFVPK
jgi:hypothetical protein